jgi:hypothetical protein
MDQPTVEAMQKEVDRIVCELTLQATRRAARRGLARGASASNGSTAAHFWCSAGPSIDGGHAADNDHVPDARLCQNTFFNRILSPQPRSVEGRKPGRRVVVVVSRLNPIRFDGDDIPSSAGVGSSCRGGAGRPVRRRPRPRGVGRAR